MTVRHGAAGSCWAWDQKWVNEYQMGPASRGLLWCKWVGRSMRFRGSDRQEGWSQGNHSEERRQSEAESKSQW